MYNEKIRKITSLTLMTIMLAGSLTFAMPGVIPDANAASKQTANLVVSTTSFGGPMVVEIIIKDPSYGDTDVTEPEPDVTFDGNDLRMIQSSDGFWYAYVAHTTNVRAFDEASTNPGLGLDFGTECTVGDTPSDVFTSLSEVSNAVLNGTASDEFSSGATIFVASDACDKDTTDTDPDMNVIRKSKLPTAAIEIFGITLGQNGLSNVNLWPFIQTWSDFTDDGTIDVVFNAGGGDQKITIEYDHDMDDRASYEFDRTFYPHGADVHLIINDNILNIDPTDQDVWTFNTTSSREAYYFLFNEAGVVQDTTELLPIINYQPIMRTTFFDDSGIMFIDPSPSSGENDIVSFQDNNDQIRYGILEGDPVVTVQETAVNSGIFENTDSNHKSNLITTINENLRGLDFIFDYVDSTTNYLVDFSTGIVNMDESGIESDWSSGEPLVVDILDNDFNTNTRLDNDFSVSGGSNAIPAIEFGSPFTLAQTIELSVDGDSIVVESDSIMDARSNVETLENSIPDLEDAVDLVYTTVGLDVDISNRTTFQGWLTTNQTNSESASATEIQLQLANNGIRVSNQGLEQIQERIDDVTFSPEQQTTVNALSSAESNLENAERVLDNLIQTDGSAIDVTLFSKILRLSTGSINLSSNPTFNINTSVDSEFLNEFTGDDNDDGVYQFFNYDASSLGNDAIIIVSGETSGNLELSSSGLTLVNPGSDLFEGDLNIEIQTKLPSGVNDNTYNIVFDVFTFGQGLDGNRYNDAIYRYEAEETTVNSGVYTGTVEYIMLNQINIYGDDTYLSLETIGDDLDIIVHEDLTDEDAVEMIYFDIDSDGVHTQTSDQMEAPTHSGIISFDQGNYKVADTVTITLEDADLNTDSDVVDIYTVVTGSDPDTGDTIALPGNELSLLLDVTFDDNLWKQCTGDHDDNPDTADEFVGGLASVISSLRETTRSSGVFVTTFQIPEQYCVFNTDGSVNDIVTVTGLDLEVNYQDFRDSSGEEIEVGDSAGSRAYTGSISLDRTVYPVPFGQPDQGVDGGGSFFAVHATAIGDDNSIEDPGRHLEGGDLTIHVRVSDPDYDVSASGEDKISESSDNGPIKIMISRGSDTVLLGTAGASSTNDGMITLGSTTKVGTNEFGPITETAPDSGIFELDLVIAYTDGPVSSTCPVSIPDAVSHIEPSVGPEDDFTSSNQHCILQGDILTVEYTDPTDASGDPNTVTDSATFDLRNGVLQSDKSVYIIGSDMILTLIEPDLDLDNDGAETYDLDLIEWDSDAKTTTMGNLGAGAVAFDPEPSNFRETGDSTGIFQIVIEIPEALDGDNLERGEEIVLEYTDWGPSGADYVGDEDEDVNITVYTSNFGATVELDQKVYTWTDKVYITIVAPDHNFDGDLIDEIGNTPDDPIKVSTRGFDIDNYKLVETGTDTGIFTGEVILTGFTSHDADGDGNENDATGITSADGGGPTDGLLATDDDDGLSVSFEFSEDETVVGSSLIRWNIGETQWLEASYPASGTGVVRVIDPDMNLNPEAVDNFNVDVYSDSDAGGIDLTVTETNEATGIFEGTVFFTTTDESSGHRLRVAEGDTVTAEYEDNTLPDPYTTSQELDITATTLIGTIVPPLERAPVANMRVVDAFNNSLDSVSVDQQVQITADIVNNQDRDQPFAYLVQIQDGNGVTVSLSWVADTSGLQPGQRLSSALSWTPTTAGSYTATAFVWESVDNPTALSPPATLSIDVS